jgi:choline kinase
MKQTTLKIREPMLKNKESLVKSEAKNHLPTRVNSLSPWAEAVGFFWMIIDDPWSIRNHAEYIKSRWKKYDKM